MYSPFYHTYTDQRERERSQLLAMVSFQPPISLNQNNKRNYEEQEEDQETFKKKSRTDQEPKSLFNSETPLPLKWQRCLDFQKRTSQDPRGRRTNLDPGSSPHQGNDHDHHVRLNLELNLQPCDDPLEKRRHGSGDATMDSRKHSWQAFERGDRRQEMTATVCVQCHMLVMLCKSSPACPNCKFMHPQDQRSSNHLC